MFEFNGIEFGHNNGVSLEPGKTYIFDSYLDVLNDIQNVFPSGGEVLLHCADEHRSPQPVVEKTKEFVSSGIKIRATICEGNTFTREGIEYRWLPRDYFANSEVFSIYQDKFVIPIGIGPDAKFMTIKNKTLSDAMRRQFEYWWKNGKAVPLP